MKNQRQRERGCSRPLERRGTYVNPDVGSLLVDDVRLRAAGHRLQALLPASRVVGGGDEEGRGQQHQLQLPLTAVQKRRPAAKKEQHTHKHEWRGAPKHAGIGSLARSTQGHSLFAVARPADPGDVLCAWKQGGEGDGQLFILCAHNLERTDTVEALHHLLQQENTREGGGTHSSLVVRLYLHQFDGGLGVFATWQCVREQLSRDAFFFFFF